MAGRRPKPTALKILEGNPGHRPLNTQEPLPTSGIPPMPEGLSKKAKREWEKVVPLLTSMKVLTEADGEALSRYCEACALAKEANQEIDKYGLTVQGATGLKKNPAVAVYMEAVRTMRAFMSEFGMTPASRSRLKVSGPAEPDPFEQYLARKNDSKQ